VGEIMIEGSIFKILEAIMGSINIPTMVHKTFDRNANFFGNASLKLVKVLEFNAKLEGELSKQFGNITDTLNRISITVFYDGNWTKRSYKHSYNSLLDGE
jgi:hypothetical protein